MSVISAQTVPYLALQMLPQAEPGVTGKAQGSRIKTQEFSMM
jgi:hypothetical protein